MPVDGRRLACVDLLRPLLESDEGIIGIWLEIGLLSDMAVRSS